MSQIEEISAYMQETYGAVPEHLFKEYPEYIVFRDILSQKWFAISMVVSRHTLNLPGEGDITIMNVKCEPDAIAFLSGLPGYLPGYHMNKQHWLTLFLDGTLSKNAILDRIDDSFRLVTDTPTRRIYEAVRRIPRGSVATYGQVAEMAGDKKMARAVGNALHKNPDPETIPCYRVVNSEGKLAEAFAFGGENIQKQLLEADGITVTDGKVDLSRFGMKIS